MLATANDNREKRAMRAVLMHQTGGPEVLTPAQVPEPTIGAPTQVRVRLKAAGVNPVDTKLRSRGTYYPQRMPAILGCDGAGVVDAVGAAVTRCQVGDAVYFCHGGIGDPPGNYAEYTVLDQRFVAAKPASLDFATAAAAPLVLITAWESLHDRAHLRPGQSVLVHAGAGGVGHVAIQLAKAVGCRVLTTVGSREKADFCRALGADATILHKENDFVQAALDLTGGTGVDIAFDTVGGKVFEQSFRAVRPYGEVVSLLQPGPEVDWKHARLRNLHTSLELMLSPMYFGWSEAIDHQAQILAQCAGLFDQGRLRVHVGQRFALEEAAAAHRAVEAGGGMGKVVLAIG